MEKNLIGRTVQKNKMKNNLKLGLAGLVLAGSLNGCMIYNIQHEIKLKKYEPLSKEQKDSLFNELNSGLKGSLKKVYIIDKEDLGKNTFAHAHYNETICFSKDSKEDSKSRFHESAHVKHFALNKSKSDFSKKWKETANFEYGKKNFKEVNWFGQPLGEFWDDKDLDFYGDGPKHGILRPRASINIQEDVANFVECLSYDINPEDIEKLDSNLINNLEEKISKMKFEIDSLVKEKALLPKPSSSLDSLLLEIKSLIIYSSRYSMSYDSSLIEDEKMRPLESISSYPLYFADTTDHRYQQKLDLLKEYEFFTNEEHEKLSKNLGSLNHLLNK